MIGFDIVSLTDSSFPSDDRRDAYAAKVMTEAEMNWWAVLPDQYVSLWTLWTIKESIYKIESKLGGARLFTHKKYEVLVGEGETPIQAVGTMGKYVANTYVAEDCVYSVVAQNMEELNTTRVAHFPLEDQDPDFQSMVVHQQLSEFLEAHPHIAEGLSEASDLDVSVSHHGLWGGFAICVLSID